MQNQHLHLENPLQRKINNCKGSSVDSSRVHQQLEKDWKKKLLFTKIFLISLLNMTLPTGGVVRQTHFPYYLCVQASATPSERVCSTTGDTLGPERSQLLPDKVNMLLFLNKNR